MAERTRRTAMSRSEVDAFLSGSHTCRVATTGPSGPHVAPLWFLWHGGALWLYSVVASRRLRDLSRDPRVAVVVDDGEAYEHLRGVEVRGRALVVGDVPRTGTPDVRLEAVEQGFHEKYRDPGAPVPYDGRHAWLCVEPERIISWDFRKIATRDGVVT